MPQQPFLSPRRAAIEARVSPKKIARWIQLGTLTPIREGNRLKISRSELEAVVGPTDATLMQLLREHVSFLMRENTDLHERVRRLERRVLPELNDDRPPSTKDLLPPPRPRSRREIARFLARHGLREETAMRWFRLDPPLPLDPAEALRYAIRHYAHVGFRGRGQMVIACGEGLCVCANVVQRNPVEQEKLS